MERFNPFRLLLNPALYAIGFFGFICWIIFLADSGQRSVFFELGSQSCSWTRQSSGGFGSLNSGESSYVLSCAELESQPATTLRHRRGSLAQHRCATATTKRDCRTLRCLAGRCDALDDGKMPIPRFATQLYAAATFRLGGMAGFSSVGDRSPRTAQSTEGRAWTSGGLRANR